MWNEGYDTTEYLRDDLLIEADRLSEIDMASFWDGYREDDLPVAERDLSYEDEFDWATAA